jgi:hypothetical protein
MIREYPLSELALAGSSTTEENHWRTHCGAAKGRSVPPPSRTGEQSLKRAIVLRTIPFHPGPPTPQTCWRAQSAWRVLIAALDGRAADPKRTLAHHVRPRALNVYSEHRCFVGWVVSGYSLWRG